MFGILISAVTRMFPFYLSVIQKLIEMIDIQIYIIIIIQIKHFYPISKSRFEGYCIR